MKKLVLSAFVLLLGLAIVGCTTTTATTATTASTESTASTTTPAPIIVQGVTATSIKIGNTAAVSGAYAGVGLPFNEGLKAVLKQVNDAGGIDGRTIEFVTYDDTFNAATGKTLTEKLINDDEVFALVGHFGTPTVGATLDIIQEVGVPMVYAATGINALYFQSSIGNPVMAVQPIYMTDGRIMAARAVKESVYGTNHDEALAAGAKIGVIYTNDDVGMSIKAGVEIEAAELGKTNDFVYQAITSGSFATAVTILKASNVSAVILAMNQEPFGYALTSMSNLALNVPVFSSYVNADITVVDHNRYNAARPVYVNAWLDIVDPLGLYGFAQSYWDFVACMTAAGFDGNTVGKANYTANSFAMAGYIAAKVFIAGLTRLETSEAPVTWANYIAAMESEAIDIPMGGVVDFTDGKRWGIAAMALLQYTLTYGDNPATVGVTETDFPIEKFNKVKNIETIETIEDK
jgi:ABC-type branched-subunit amino acid transport system substrate-binding protein